MLGLFLLITIPVVIFTCNIDHIRPEEITEIPCMFTDLNVTNKYVAKRSSENGLVVYDYEMTLNVSNAMVYITRNHRRLENLLNDRELINQSMVCYDVRGELLFDEPISCDDNCSREFCLTLLITATIIGFMFEFMISNNLSF